MKLNNNFRNGWHSHTVSPNKQQNILIDFKKHIETKLNAKAVMNFPQIRKSPIQEYKHIRVTTANRNAPSSHFRTIVNIQRNKVREQSPFQVKPTNEDIISIQPMTRQATQCDYTKKILAINQKPQKLNQPSQVHRCQVSLFNNGMANHNNRNKMKLNKRDIPQHRQVRSPYLQHTSLVSNMRPLSQGSIGSKRQPNDLNFYNLHGQIIESIDSSQQTSYLQSLPGFYQQKSPNKKQKKGDACLQSYINQTIVQNNWTKMNDNSIKQSSRCHQIWTQKPRPQTQVSYKTFNNKSLIRPQSKKEVNNQKSSKKMTPTVKYLKDNEQWRDILNTLAGEYQINNLNFVTPKDENTKQSNHFKLNSKFFNYRTVMYSKSQNLKGHMISSQRRPANLKQLSMKNGNVDDEIPLDFSKILKLGNSSIKRKINSVIPYTNLQQQSKPDMIIKCEKSKSSRSKSQTSEKKASLKSSERKPSNENQGPKEQSCSFKSRTNSESDESKTQSQVRNQSSIVNQGNALNTVRPSISQKKNIKKPIQSQESDSQICSEKSMKKQISINYGLAFNDSNELLNKRGSIERQVQFIQTKKTREDQYLGSNEDDFDLRKAKALDFSLKSFTSQESEKSESLTSESQSQNDENSSVEVDNNVIAWQVSFQSRQHSMNKLYDLFQPKSSPIKITIQEKMKLQWAKFLFKPNSPFKIKWDILIIILSVWNSIEIPFMFAFPGATKNLVAIEVTDFFIDFLFAFDILINFRTFYIDEKTDALIEDPKSISQNYIRGRFWIDLFASIPFEMFTFVLESNQVKIFGMLKLVRLMRLGRMATFLKANKSFKLGIILMQLIFILILVIHWIACLWLIVTNQMRSWSPLKDLDWDKTEVYSGSIDKKFNIYFYYSILTLVTNDLLPTTEIELLISVVILIIGSFTIGILIGEFSAILNDMNERAQKVNETVDLLQSFMSNLKLPEEFHNIVQEYYESINVSKFVHQDNVFDHLNKCMTNEIQLFLLEEAILKSNLITGDNSILVKTIAGLFKIQHFQEQEIVIKQDDIGNSFYIICEGIVEVVREKADFNFFDFQKKKQFMDAQMIVSYKRKNKNFHRKRASLTNDDVAKIREEMRLINQGTNDSYDNHNQEDCCEGNSCTIINDLERGSYFGEVSLLTNLRRTSTVYTVSKSFFGVIDRQTFEKMLSTNAHLKHNLIARMNRYRDDAFTSMILMLRNAPLFNNLRHTQIRKIISRLKPVQFENSQRIIQTGQYCDKMFFIKKGQVSIVVKDLDKPNDIPNFLITLRQGSCFNTMGSILERPSLFEYISGSQEAVGILFKNPLTSEMLCNRKHNEKHCMKSHKNQNVELYMLTRQDLEQLEISDPEIQNVLEAARDKYQHQHTKYDFNALLFRSIIEQKLAQKSQKLINEDKFIAQRCCLHTAHNHIQVMRLMVVRKKVMKQFWYFKRHRINLSELKIFLLIDKVYSRFVGANRNLKLTLLMNNGEYNLDTQQKVFDLIRLVQEKNKKNTAVNTVTNSEKGSMVMSSVINTPLMAYKLQTLCNKRINEPQPFSYTLSGEEKFYLEQMTAGNSSTIQTFFRFKSQLPFQQMILNHPQLAIQHIQHQFSEFSKSYQNAKRNIKVRRTKQIMYSSKFESDLKEFLLSPQLTPKSSKENQKSPKRVPSPHKKGTGITHQVIQQQSREQSQNMDKSSSSQQIQYECSESSKVSNSSRRISITRSIMKR